MIRGMKAIRARQFGGPEVLALEEVPDPKAGPGQVVVRAKAVGVNPVDVSIRTELLRLMLDLRRQRFDYAIIGGATFLRRALRLARMIRPRTLGNREN